MRPVLLVDDNPADTELLAIGFEDAGIVRPLAVVHDGEQALAWLTAVRDEAARRPALVVLDLNLPRLDGLRVLEWLREESVYRGTAVAVVTSSRRDDEALRCAALGAHFLAKASSFAELRALCARLAGLLPAEPGALKAVAG